MTAKELIEKLQQLPPYAEVMVVTVQGRHPLNTGRTEWMPSDLYIDRSGDVPQLLFVDSEAIDYRELTLDAYIVGRLSKGE